MLHFHIKYLFKIVKANFRIYDCRNSLFVMMGLMSSLIVFQLLLVIELLWLMIARVIGSIPGSFLVGNICSCVVVLVLKDSLCVLILMYKVSGHYRFGCMLMMVVDVSLALRFQLKLQVLECVEQFLCCLSFTGLRSRPHFAQILNALQLSTQNIYVSCCNLTTSYWRQLHLK